MQYMCLHPTSLLHLTHHNCELVVDKEYLRMRTHRIKLGVPRKVINEAHVIKETPKRGRRCMTQNIRMYKIEGGNKNRETDSLDEKGRAICFANMQPIPIKSGLDDTGPSVHELVNSFRRALKR